MSDFSSRTFRLGLQCWFVSCLLWLEDLLFLSSWVHQEGSDEAGRGQLRWGVALASSSEDCFVVTEGQAWWQLGSCHKGLLGFFSVGDSSKIVFDSLLRVFTFL